MKSRKPEELDVQSKYVNYDFFNIGIAEIKKIDKEQSVKAKIACFIRIHEIINKS